MASFWHTTCTALRQGQEPDWEAIGNYRQPLLMLVRSRNRGERLGDSEDIVDDILLALKEKLHKRYDSHRGRFRNFLCGVVRTELLKRWKSRVEMLPLEDIPEPAAPSPQEGAAVDLVAEILVAMRDWHRRHLRGPERSKQRIYVVTGRLIKGLSNREIMAQEGLSLSSVKRILAEMRSAVIGGILDRTMQLDAGARAGLDWQRLGALVRRRLLLPGNEDALDEIGGEALQRAVQQWIDSYGEALCYLPQDGTDRAAELKAGLDLIFKGD